MNREGELETGDVFKMKRGMYCYAYLPEKEIYENRKHSNKLAETDIKLGPEKSKFHGDYVVISTAKTGGGTGMGPHDVYPDGHQVTARKLKDNGKWDSKGIKIRFYQSGCFTAMNPKVKVIRVMKMNFK